MTWGGKRKRLIEQSQEEKQASPPILTTVAATGCPGYLSHPPSFMSINVVAVSV
jgi:hypothetical protein